MIYSVLVEFLVSANEPDEALALLEASFENLTENPGIEAWSVPDPGAEPASPEQVEYLREIDRGETGKAGDDGAAGETDG